MSQSLVTSLDIANRRFTIKGPEAHHLIVVLRKKEGDEVRLFDGKSCRFMGIITTVDVVSGTIIGTVSKMLDADPSLLPFHLFQGLPRAGRFDYVIEKSVEVGVHKITPFLSSKNLIQLTPDQKNAKRNRWQNVSRAAAKQSGRGDIPEICSVLEWRELLEVLDGHSTLIFDPDGERTLKDVVGELYSRRDWKQGCLQIVVGPESGFSPAELSEFRGRGAPIVTLGQPVLRSETAPVVILSILNYLFNG